MSRRSINRDIYDFKIAQAKEQSMAAWYTALTTSRFKKHRRMAAQLTANAEQSMEQADGQ